VRKHKTAIADFQKAIALQPKDDSVKKQLIATQKYIRKLDFEKVKISLIFL
jgi:hypothetical protein